MGTFRRFLLRLANVVRSGRGEPDLAREVASHLRLLEDEFRRRGMPSEQARLAARRAFGNIELTKDTQRDARSFRSLDDIKRDIGHAFRVFRRAPIFHAGIVLTLALGIGANAAVFSILRAVLLQPLPYRDADRVVMVWESGRHPPVGLQNEMLQGREWMRGGLSLAMFTDWREESKDIFADMAAILPARSTPDAEFDLVLRDHAERLNGALVTPNFFELLGATAVRGRLFNALDEGSRGPLIVLSDALWRSAFAADPGIVGRSVTLIGGWQPRAPKTFVIVGVLPPAFRFTYPEETQLWVLESWADLARRPRRAYCCEAIARLKSGVAFDTASARMATIQTDFPPKSDRMIRLERVYDWVVGETRPSLLLLGAVALLLLTITCATAGNALLVRTVERRREFAVRASLGADRGRLVRQLLVEGAVLSAFGAAAGTLSAALTAPLVRSLIPAAVPRADGISMNGWMLLFGIGAAILTMLVAAVAPAWHGARVDPAPALKSSSSTASGDRAAVRWRHGLVVAQVAIATVLLVSAALLLVSFWRLGRVPLGFDGHRVLTVQMELQDYQYRGKWLPNGAFQQSLATVAFRQELAQRVRALPGVLDAGITSAVPFRGTDFTVVLHSVGQTKTVVGNERMVDADYFSVMRIPLLRGRLFTASDTATSRRVAVVSESYARQMFGMDDPIGQRIAYGEGAKEIVGVVGDVRYVALDRNPQPALYIPAVQGSSSLVCLVARTAQNAADLGPAIRGIIHDLDPSLPAMNMTTIDQIIDQSVASRRFYTTATGAFAAVALGLTLVGLVVIVGRSVVERRRELAIRSALGATSRGILGLVVRQGLAPVVAGTVIGLAATYIGSNVLAQFLFEVAPHSSSIYLSAAVVILTIAAGSILVPSRRAAAIDAAQVLRAE